MLASCYNPPLFIVSQLTNIFGQVEIKRTIPKGSGDSKDFKTKKIFVGGIPTSVIEGEVFLALAAFPTLSYL